MKSNNFINQVAIPYVSAENILGDKYICMQTYSSQLPHQHLYGIFPSFQTWQGTTKEIYLFSN